MNMPKGAKGVVLVIGLVIAAFVVKKFLLPEGIIGFITGLVNK
jgi:hypothetical protein